LRNGKRTTLITALIVTLSTGMQMAIADSLVVPNDFSAGQPASAAEVNDNFAAVKSSVDDNDNRITDNSAAIQLSAAAIVSDGSGARIGRLVSISSDVGYVFARVITDKSFIFELRLADGSMDTYAAPLFFTTVNCSGTAYLSSNPGGFVSVAYDLAGVPKPFYTAKDSLPTAESLQFFSMTTGGGCASQSVTSGFGWTAIPNDPAVTGVSNSPYSVPITID